MYRIFKYFIYACKHIIVSLTSLSGTRTQTHTHTHFESLDSLRIPVKKWNDDRTHKFVWKHKWHFRVKIIIYGDVCSIVRFVLIVCRTHYTQIRFSMIPFFFISKKWIKCIQCQKECAVLCCVSCCMFVCFADFALKQKFLGIEKTKVLGYERCDESHWLWIHPRSFSYSHSKFQLYTYLSLILCVG